MITKLVEECRPFANKFKNPEDVLQDAVVWALVYLKHNELPKNPKPWFMELIKHSNSKQVEKNSRVSRNCSKVNSLYADRGINPYPGIDAKIDLDSAMSSLGSDESVARLYYVEQYTMQEIAVKLGKSKPTISRQISGIERKLKEWGQSNFGSALSAS